MPQSCLYEPPSIDAIIYNTKEYFGINIDKNTYTYNMSHFLSIKESNIMGNNNLIARTELKSLLQSLFFNINQTYTKIYFSRTPVSLHDIIDSSGKKIFANLPNQEGWFVFVDPIIIANWSHDCEYWFIVNQKTIYKSLTEQWAPNNLSDLENFNLI
ncbi:hypothetical protein [Clostridium intestinale]|uniref:Uncharacterized protein n=1 Tax=Clostridium intestinale URNW TaxID=1294142 RepID=U2Q3A0_9CLOT|nr:hypothetical protein [Clostridium intestinale]ERK30534.1 hypothetical protein CINTURNW_1650 [Clostridium intestinale URNW]